MAITVSIVEDNDQLRGTLARVINRSPLVQDDTRARIEAVMQRYRYVPDPQARGLAFRKAFLIGLVYDNPNAQYIVNMLEGALDGLRGTECELVVHPCDRTSAGFVAGVFCCGGGFTCPACCASGDC